MFCSQCGSEAPSSAHFCSNCGRSLQGTDVAPGRPGDIQTHLAPVILVTPFYCVPSGIAARYYAAQVNTRVALGDYQTAIKLSGKAKKWSWISFWLGFIAIGLYLAASIVFGFDLE